MLREQAAVWRFLRDAGCWGRFLSLDLGPIGGKRSYRLQFRLWSGDVLILQHVREVVQSW